MEKRINIAELLKDCPQGMELDCAMWSDVKFDEVEMGDSYPICIKVGEGYEHLTEFGHWNLNENAKCVIFPKGKTTWEGFVPPCKFKVGDRIRLKENHNYIYTITGIRKKENKYECGVTFVLRFSEQDNWELVPNKFDVSTFIPFESRVLVRDSDVGIWLPEFFGCLCNDNDYPYMIVGGTRWKYCIPYEGNEHLINTTQNCEDFYVTRRIEL